MEWWSGVFLSAYFGPYILLAVSGRNFPFGGEIFEILTASEPRMDTNSHESALIPDFGLPTVAAVIGGLCACISVFACIGGQNVSAGGQTMSSLCMG